MSRQPNFIPTPGVGLGDGLNKKRKRFDDPPDDVDHTVDNTAIQPPAAAAATATATTTTILHTHDNHSPTDATHPLPPPPNPRRPRPPLPPHPLLRPPHPHPLLHPHRPPQPNPPLLPTPLPPPPSDRLARLAQNRIPSQFPRGMQRSHLVGARHRHFHLGVRIDLRGGERDVVAGGVDARGGGLRDRGFGGIALFGGYVVGVRCDVFALGVDEGGGEGGGEGEEGVVAKTTMATITATATTATATTTTKAATLRTFFENTTVEWYRHRNVCPTDNLGLSHPDRGARSLRQLLFSRIHSLGGWNRLSMGADQLFATYSFVFALRHLGGVLVI
mmetsp:Transcript_7018/g.15093  ORF Transcript_7018/g.15093 Transcript_7018/m.15093 type:complete len:332 (-) Transcript_7018:42-1037(-)